MSENKNNPGVEQKKTQVQQGEKKKNSAKSAAAKPKSAKTSKPRTRRPITKKPHSGPELDFSSDSLDLLIALKNNVSQVRSGNEKSTIVDIKKSIDIFFRKHKIEEFGKAGEKYDPKKHYSFLFMKEAGVEENQVLEVRSTGLKVGKNIIKKSKVIVSK